MNLGWLLGVGFGVAMLRGLAHWEKRAETKARPSCLYSPDDFLDQIRRDAVAVVSLGDDSADYTWTTVRSTGPDDARIAFILAPVASVVMHVSAKLLIRIRCAIEPWGDGEAVRLQLGLDGVRGEVYITTEHQDGRNLAETMKWVRQYIEHTRCRRATVEAAMSKEASEET